MSSQKWFPKGKYGFIGSFGAKIMSCFFSFSFLKGKTSISLTKLMSTIAHRVTAHLVDEVFFPCNCFSFSSGKKNVFYIVIIDESVTTSLSHI